MRLVLLIVLSYFSMYSIGASFDCSKAKSANEKLICSNETLSRLDDALSQEYQKLLKQYSDTKPVMQWQRSWLRSEALNCKDSDCLIKSYQKRIIEIKSAMNSDRNTAAYTGIYFRFDQNKLDKNKSEIVLVGLSNSQIAINGKSIFISNGNTGEMSGYGKVKDGLLIGIDESQICGAEIRFVNGGFSLENEYGCGGINVTFNGKYIKQ